ncbi:hypothetical protein [Methylophaga nitratireducenticrescens]|uniref:hypothetical protein n=1 Tax=Methylophaga nitratireducenticrescens TaxID=754476 RepID=UPI00059E89C2|nr:hypothetical protein [Methylophaga nitratireducenticrescens]ASF49050.1 hypothetical protein Q7A_03145 [Methylophaga nitratireducenticrescens]AUZ83223.1 hypothetical protein CDW43_00900 [Methylophaga nitratireducenticrescens]
MSNSKITRTSILLMFSLFIIGFSVNQARADVRINIGLGHPTGYVDHHHSYIVQQHASRYSYSRHYHHQPKKHFSKHRKHYIQQKKYYSNHKHHPEKTYRGKDKHRDHYRYECRKNHRDYRYRN